MFKTLSQREQLMVIGAALLCVVTLGYFAVLAPYQHSIAALDSKIAARARQLQEVQQLQQRYQRLETTIKSAQKQQGNAATNNDNFSLFALVETQISRSAGRENLISMRPLPSVSSDQIREDSVEVKLDNLSLAQLTQFLQSLDSAGLPLQVKSLLIKVRFDNPDQLSSSLLISAYSKETP